MTERILLLPNLPSPAAARAARRHAVAIAALLSACSDNPADGPPSLELGVGEVTLSHAGPDAPAQLAAGTQGGHHIWLSMRVRGLDPSAIRMVLDVVPTPPAPPARSDIALDFQPAQDAGQGVYEYLGWPARVLAPECAVDQPVLLLVQLTDRAGRQVQSELEVIATSPRNGFSMACSL